MSEPSEQQRENLELTRRGYELFNAGDLEGLIGICHEQIEIYLPEDEGAIWGTYRGHEGYRTWFREWLDAFDEYTAEVQAIEPVGERHVVTLAHQSAKGKGAASRSRWTPATCSSSATESSSRCTCTSDRVREPGREPLRSRSGAKRASPTRRADAGLMAARCD
jgi:ketosteroid isomerase-like protein